MLEFHNVLAVTKPPRTTLRIKAVQIICNCCYCDTPTGPTLPEMGKTRAVIVVSHGHTLRSQSKVMPVPDVKKEHPKSQQQVIESYMTDEAAHMRDVGYE